MSKKIGLFLGAAAIVLVPVITVIIVMQTRSSTPAGNAISEEGYRGMPNGLLIKDEVVGSGEEVQAGRRITVHYTGKFMDGKQFDSSRGKDPFEVTLGGGTVIKGWEEGLVGMKVGGTRKLIVPPDLAYGKSGAQGIPPNSRLYFEIELLGIDGSAPASASISDEGYRGTPSGLKIKDDLVGGGEELKVGKTAVVHYTGKFMDGRQFDSSIGKEPFRFPTIGGQVIRGWEEGVVGMKVGGKRKLIVPPELAYGANGNASIPPNSKLYFEIELLKVE